MRTFTVGQAAQAMSTTAPVLLITMEGAYERNQSIIGNVIVPTLGADRMHDLIFCGTLMITSDGIADVIDLRDAMRGLAGVVEELDIVGDGVALTATLFVRGEAEITLRTAAGTIPIGISIDTPLALAA